MSRSFEELCCSALRSLYPEDTITQTGQWWYGEHKFDVMGLSAGDTLTAGECKFQQSLLGYDAFSKLERHVAEPLLVVAGRAVREGTFLYPDCAL